jgi:hypothetical protein
MSAAVIHLVIISIVLACSAAVIQPAFSHGLHLGIYRGQGHRLKYEPGPVRPVTSPPGIHVNRPEPVTSFPNPGPVSPFIYE